MVIVTAMLAAVMSWVGWQRRKRQLPNVEQRMHPWRAEHLEDHGILEIPAFKVHEVGSGKTAFGDLIVYNLSSRYPGN